MIAATCIFNSLKTQATANYPTYKTSRGAVFTRVQPPGNFGLGWMDPSGMVWSRYLGEFSNDALKPDDHGKITESQATLACAQIGAQLPSAQDYKRLASYFALNPQGFFEEIGVRDINTVFPDLENRWFWSSTVDPHSSKGAYEFEGNNGCAFDQYLYVYLARHLKGGVRCVVSGGAHANGSK